MATYCRRPLTAGGRWASSTVFSMFFVICVWRSWLSFLRVLIFLVLVQWRLEPQYKTRKLISLSKVGTDLANKIKSSIQKLGQRKIAVKTSKIHSFIRLSRATRLKAHKAETMIRTYQNIIIIKDFPFITTMPVLLLFLFFVLMDDRLSSHLKRRFKKMHQSKHVFRS